MNVKKILEEAKKIATEEKQVELANLEKIVNEEQEANQKHLDELNQYILELTKHTEKPVEYKDFMDELIGK